MTLTDTSGPVLYLGIFIAAIVEGEISFVAAATLASRGLLDPIGVIAAGAAGAAIGDQTYFYLLRGRLHRWLDRFPALSRRREGLVRRIQRHQIPMVFAIRFAPGLRIALAAACAYANVAPLRFSLLNSLAAIVWATGLLVIVAWAGPALLSKLGLSGWWGAVVPALIIVVLARLLSRAERRTLEQEDAPPRA
jgi:membrane protein DedA with SNARE-associated domain